MSAALAAKAALGLYRTVGRIATPLVESHLERRRDRGREDPERLAERLGRDMAPRPTGPLVWLHAASVGESLSALPLLQRIRSDWPQLNLLVTTGTVTSARMMAERLPQGAIHQYVPVDLIGAIERFMDHWQPALGLLVESEFWPNLLTAAKARGCELVLVNGRVSPASYRSWRRFAPGIRFLLAQFAEVFAQSPEDLAHFEALGAPQARCLGNLKFAAPPPEADADQLAAFRARLQDRPLWLAASTHAGEEAIAGTAHRALRARHPGLLTLVVPRHPDRGAAVAEELRGLGLAVAQRSRGESVGPEVDVYLADTMGELGLWYRLAPLVFIGKSLTAQGGQNPLEAAKLGCAILFGPHSANFLRVCEEMEAAGALRRVADGDALTAALSELLQDAALRDGMGRAAQGYGAAQAGVLEATLAALASRFERIAAQRTSTP